MSAFVLEGGIIYHTYSTYARGLDATRRISGGGATTSTCAEPIVGVVNTFLMVE
jgi:hypothetical protein